MYYIEKGNYNPVIGIAAVSCVPTTAKVAQKIVSKDNPDSFILGDALGAQYIGSYYFSNYYRYLYHNHPAIMKQHESYLMKFHPRFNNAIIFAEGSPRICPLPPLPTKNNWNGELIHIKLPIPFL